MVRLYRALKYLLNIAILRKLAETIADVLRILIHHLFAIPDNATKKFVQKECRLEK